eukprot:7265839-Prymnesium_polylepis.1
MAGWAAWALVVVAGAQQAAPLKRRSGLRLFRAALSMARHSQQVVPRRRASQNLVACCSPCPPSFPSNPPREDSNLDSWRRV